MAGSWLAGRKAKQRGDEFEEILRVESIRRGIYPIVIPDGAKRVSRTFLVPCKTPFDIVLVKDGRSVFIDCKSLGDVHTIKSARLKEHQVASAKAICEFKCVAGYLVWFRSINKVTFFSGTQLHALKFGQSLDQKDGLDIGTIENMDLNRLFSLYGL